MLDKMRFSSEQRCEKSHFNVLCVKKKVVTVKLDFSSVISIWEFNNNFQKQYKLEDQWLIGLFVCLPL